VPRGTTLVVTVNPNNSNGGIFDIAPLPDLLQRYPGTAFVVDEAFIDPGGRSVAPLVERHANLLVVRTLQGSQPGGLPGGLCRAPAGARRRPQRSQRRLSPGAAKQGVILRRHLC
jgi:hypothetical protein